MLTGCLKFEPAKEAVVSPGKDPLVNLTYKKLLLSNGIKYTINKDGYYVSDKSNLKEMDVLATKAHDELRDTREIRLSSRCVARAVKKQLKGVIYITYKTDNGAFLKAASSVFDKNQIIVKVSLANEECQGNV